MRSTIRYSHHSAKVDKGNRCDPTSATGIANVMYGNKNRVARRFVPVLESSAKSDFARKLESALKQ